MIANVFNRDVFVRREVAVTLLAIVDDAIEFNHLLGRHAYSPSEVAGLAELQRHLTSELETHARVVPGEEVETRKIGDESRIGGAP